MGFIGVGGDGSVAWVTDVDNARPGSTKSQAKGNKGHRQEGIDEAATGDFTLSIRLPKVAPDRFLDELRGALNNPTGGKIVVKVPIEQQTPDQIRVEWKSL
jgi:hypothetical protein